MLARHKRVLIQQPECTGGSGRVRASKAATLLPLLTIILLGCGGGGENSQPAGGFAAPPAPQPVTFELIFPSEVSLTDATQITVVGKTEANRVTSVTIKNGTNDVSATQDGDGSWRATAVPLQPGANNLSAELTATDGSVTEHAIAVVQSLPILSNPTGVSFDAVNNRVFIVDAKQLLAFNLATESLEVISSPQIGAGPEFGFNLHLASAGDGAVLVSDLRRVLRVDPATGDRTEHIVLPAGAGPITSIALDEQLNRLFTVGFFKDLHVADLDAAPPIMAAPVNEPPPFGFSAGGPIDSTYVAATNSVYTANPSFLDVSVFDAATGESSSLMVNQGNFIAPLMGIDFDNDQQRLLVLASSGAVFEVDPVAGSSNVLIAAPQTVTALNAINGLTQGVEKLWTVSPVAGELISIDMSSGDQTIEADSRVGSGEPPGPTFAGRYDPVTDRFVAVSDLRIIAIDPKTGVRELLADLSGPPLAIGQPPALPSFFQASGLALSQDGTHAWLTDMFAGRLAEVNLGTGEMRVVSGPNTGIGPQLDQIAGIAVSPDETLAYLGDRFSGRIFRVDLLSGQRDLLPDFATSLGPIEIRGLVLDANANRLIVNIAPFSHLSTTASGIYALDLSSFDFRLIADFTSVELPRNEIRVPGFLTAQMSLSTDGSILFFPVNGNPDVPYASIDLALGEVVPLGSAASGPPFFVPNAIEAAPDGRLFVLDSTSALFVIDGQTGERAVVSK